LDVQEEEFARTRILTDPASGHHWPDIAAPGNVRELQNVIERAVILCEDSVMLETEHCYLSAPSRPAAPAPSSSLPIDNPVAASTVPGDACTTLHELEKRHIIATLKQCQNNRTQAAKVLDISVRTLRNKLQEYGASAALPDEAEQESLPPEQTANAV
jgi:DNA-binding NtrC family response regulator